MAKRDRQTSSASEDKRLTGNLINATMSYLYADTPDEEFAGVVLEGCTTQGSEYPPKGHGYPRTNR